MSIEKRPVSCLSQRTEPASEARDPRLYVRRVSCPGYRRPEDSMVHLLHEVGKAGRGVVGNPLETTQIG